MTSKELLYIEDAISHECFLKSSCENTSKKLTDPTLSTYLKELETEHSNLLNKFSNLL